MVVTGTVEATERLTIDQSEALFRTRRRGREHDARIEVVANLGDAADQVVVIGTPGDDKLSVPAESPSTPTTTST